MRPEIRQQILPVGLLAAGVVCGGVCWLLQGTAFWVVSGATFAFIVAGIAVAGRTEAAGRK